MLVPHGNDRVRTIQLKGSTVRAALALALVLLLLAGTFAVGFFVKQSHEVRALLLERENRALAAEVEQMRSEMSALRGSLDVLAEKDEKYRMIAGLPASVPAAEEAAPQEPTAQERPGAVRSLYAATLVSLNPVVGRKVVQASDDLDALLRRADELSSSLDQAISTLEAHGERLDATPSIAPSEGALSSLFGNRRHPVMRITRPHKGIDIAAPVGEPIHAPAAGRVVHAGPSSGGYGNMVAIDHGYGYVTRFAHASKVLVRTGQRVKRGDLIAEVGATGLVSGPHLHYEVEVNGKQVDPLNFIISDALPD